MSSASRDSERYLRYQTIGPDPQRVLRVRWWCRRWFSVSLSMSLRAQGAFDSVSKKQTLENSSELVGERAGKILNSVLSKRARSLLSQMRVRKGPPYLLIQNLAAVPRGFSRGVERPREQYVTDRQRIGAKKRRLLVIDSVAAGLLHALGAKADYQFQSVGQMARDLLSAPGQGQIQHRDGYDMPLRFHQSMVEKDFPVSKDVVIDPMCTFKTYVGLRNWRQVPIYLLTVEDLLASIDEAVKEQTIANLQRAEYTLTAPIHDDAADPVLPDTAKPKPILVKDPLQNGNEPTKFIMAYDPNRVADAGDADCRRAIGALRNAVSQAQKNRLCRRIVVKWRDVLVVDNLRALVSRREFDPYPMDLVRMLVGSKDRWLRQLYGVPLKIDSSK